MTSDTAHSEFLRMLRNWTDPKHEVPDELLIEMIEAGIAEDLGRMNESLRTLFTTVTAVRDRSSDLSAGVIVGAINSYVIYGIGADSDSPDNYVDLFREVESTFEQVAVKTPTQLLHEEAQHALLRAITKAASVHGITAPELVELSDAYLRLPAPGEDEPDDD